METFKWKFWRFAWMTHANWGWTTTLRLDRGEFCA